MRTTLLTVAGCIAMIVAGTLAHSRWDWTPDAARSRMLNVLLSRSLTVRFHDVAARDAFASLQTILGINIVGRYADDRLGFGIDPEQPITLEAALDQGSGADAFGDGGGSGVG